MLFRKYLTKMDQVSILPSLLMTEVLTWVYAFKPELPGLKAKVQSIMRTVPVETPSSRMGLKRIIHHLEWRVPLDQLSCTKVDKPAKTVSNLSYDANYRVLRE
jgi:hypothetical protein